MNIKINIKKYLLIFSFFVIMPCAGGIKAANEKIPKLQQKHSYSPKSSENINSQPAPNLLTEWNTQYKTGKKEVKYFPVKVQLPNSSVEIIPFLDYVVGATAKEYGIGMFHREALKAGAVCIASYAIGKCGLNGTFIADNNVFQSFEPLGECEKKFGKSNLEYLKKIISSVIEKIPTIDGIPLECLYHTISSGRTENNENVWKTAPVAYLASKFSPVKTFNEAKQQRLLQRYRNIKKPKLKLKFGNVETFVKQFNENYKKTVKIKIEDAFKKVNEYIQKEKQKNNQIATPTLPANSNKIENYIKITKLFKNSNNPEQFQIFGVPINSFTLKNLFSLRSHCITPKCVENNEIVLEVKGWGHCVGLDQYGSNIMALYGSNYKEIINNFYKPKNADIKYMNIKDINPKYIFKNLT